MSKNLDIFLGPTASSRFMYFIINSPDGTLGIKDSSDIRTKIDAMFKDLQPSHTDQNGKDIWVPGFNFLSLENNAGSLLGSLENYPDVHLC